MHRSFVIIILSLVTIALSNGQHDSAFADSYKKLPPDGIAIDPKVRKDLEDRVRDLQTSIDRAAQDSADSESWTPEVEVFVRAVRLALEQNLFFKKSEPEHATKLLDEAARRLTAVESGERGLRLLGLAEVASDQPQLLVGGFRSSIDDSVQPYGLVIPANYVN
ncbi:MAG: hypothetical protein ACR2NZ_03270, partial [Rubripirellula sp.]